MIDVSAPLDLDDGGAAAFLDGIQGNVLKAHARDFAAHILIRFRPSQPDARKWVGQFGQSFVSSAGEQMRQSKTFRETGDGGTFGGLGLSAAGYAALGISAAPADARFRSGMKQSQDLGGTDPPPSDSNDFATVGVGVDATIGRSENPFRKHGSRRPMPARPPPTRKRGSRWPISSRCAAANISFCPA